MAEIITLTKRNIVQKTCDEKFRKGRHENRGRLQRRLRILELSNYNLGHSVEKDILPDLGIVPETCPVLKIIEGIKKLHF